MERKFFKRKFHILIFFSLLFALLIARLSYIQMLGTESFSAHQVNLIKKSVQQRQQQMILHSGRGEIRDRHNLPLTGHSSHVAVLFPLSKKVVVKKEDIVEISKILKVTEEDLLERIEKLKEPSIFKNGKGIVRIDEHESNRINQLKVPGVIGLPYEIRYQPENRVAQHFIGYIGENKHLVETVYADELAQGNLTENSIIGISGLERTFQPFLQGIGPTALNYYVDGRGKPLQGMEIKYTEAGNPFYPLTIVSTLDLELQKAVEDIMSKNYMRQGTVLILDSKSSEILAVASSPKYTEQINSVKAWENKAFKRYPPGSIFKIVIAAAAIEEDKLQSRQKFECKGKIEGTNIHCWKKEGHGLLSFEEGFAQSCNIVFGQLAKELGPNKIEEYATKLGLTERNGWQIEHLFHYKNFAQIDGEEQGQIFSPLRIEQDRMDKSYIMQTGIGQLDVQVSPLAVANMMATITKGGKKHQVQGVKEIYYQTGTSFYQFEQQRMSGPTISRLTAYRLQKLLEKVVQVGTARVLKDKDLQVAGKTGTAQITSQSGQVLANHQWFAGYYPLSRPQYVIVVVNLHQEPNTKNISVTTFADIVAWLEKKKIDRLVKFLSEGILSYVKNITERSNRYGSGSKRNSTKNKG